MPMPAINSASLPLKVQEERDIVIKHSFRSSIVDLSCQFSHNELAKLYRMIEKAIPDKSHRIVQFMSAYKEEGASEIALETAIIAARFIGQRVLFIDTSATLVSKRKKILSGMPTTSLETLLLSGGSPYEAIAQAAGTELYFAMLCEKRNDGLAPIPLNAIGTALENLRPYFDLIIVDSQAVLSDAFGMALVKLVDGSVMVIEAEHTRAQVAAECKHLIEGSGGHLIGAVMSRRRLHIPNWLYGLLYKRISR